MSCMQKLRNYTHKLLRLDSFTHLQSVVIPLNSVGELRKVYGWQQMPILDLPSIHDFCYVEDVNERRIRDAETLATVARNADPKVCVDIGTAFGYSAALIACNAPEAHIFTINIPPEEIPTGEGGCLTTIALDREKIGSYYRKRNLTNITQLYINTSKWVPSMDSIDIAFIDGCHDSEFVYNDTQKVLKGMRSGSFILWHDFNLELVHKYPSVHSVCSGVERLFRDRILSGRVFHVRDSWIGVHRVE
jgi:predicted O-methyltransferase YrrM